MVRLREREREPKPRNILPIKGRDFPGTVSETTPRPAR